MEDLKLYTPWGEKLDKNCVLPEYPRPQFARDSYINLNGVWQYAILPSEQKLTQYQGEIVVPFSPEALLSGVDHVLTPNETLYYRRTFVLPEGFNKGKVLLNFGAVDYFCKVFVNGVEVGSHKNGYLPFDFDITSALKEGENELCVAVTDPTDTGVQAYGKQKLENSGIWYTPNSGIWQTVWLESVPCDYAVSLRITPVIEKDSVDFELKYCGTPQKGHLCVKNGDTVIAEGDITDKLSLKLNAYELWCPENPKLYNVELSYGEDSVTSYFGMRSFGIGKDALGVPRLMLNGKPYFHNGLLDQGYWSDGLYTPPSDDAMIFDIKTMKDMGFNMLRKHIKIEPLRWYYHCDRLGMLVWQDMVSGGDSPYKFSVIGANPFFGLLFGKRKLGAMNDGPKNYKQFARASEATREEYYNDLQATLETLVNCVSISLWVPFNEGWGQFESLNACRIIRAYDPTRLLDHASGWHDQGGPDLLSFHIYFTRFVYPRFNKKDKRPIAISEFGGYSYIVPEHVHNKDTSFGYRFYKTGEKLAENYKKLFDKYIIPSIASGLSATVYTQVSDVQDEVNGLLSYDRRIIKIPVEFVKQINDSVKL